MKTTLEDRLKSNQTGKAPGRFVRFTLDQDKKIVDLATLNGVTISQIVRELVAVAFEREE